MCGGESKVNMKYPSNIYTTIRYFSYHWDLLPINMRVLVHNQIDYLSHKVALFITSALVV